MRSYFIKIGLQVEQLGFQLFAVIAQHCQELFQLGRSVARTVVRVDDFLGLDELKAQTLGAQRQHETGSVSGAVHTVAPRRPFSQRLQKTHVFIKTHRTRGQVKLFCEITDGVGGRHGNCRLVE